MNLETVLKEMEQASNQDNIKLADYSIEDSPSVVDFRNKVKRLALDWFPTSLVVIPIVLHSAVEPPSRFILSFFRPVSGVNGLTLVHHTCVSSNDWMLEAADNTGLTARVCWNGNLFKPNPRRSQRRHR